MNKYITYILISLLIVAYATATFPDPAKIGTTGTKPSNQHFLDSGKNTKPLDSKPAVTLFKRSPRIIKTNIQVEVILLAGQFPMIERYFIIKQDCYYRHTPKASYIRYLARDPSIA